MVLLGACPGEQGAGRGGGAWAAQRASVPGAHRCRGGLRVLRLLTPVLRDQRAAAQGHAGDPTPAGPADHCRYGPPPGGPGAARPFQGASSVSSLPDHPRAPPSPVRLLRKVRSPPAVGPQGLRAPFRRASEQSGEARAPAGRSVVRAPWRQPSRHPPPPAPPVSSLGSPLPSRTWPWLLHVWWGPRVSELLSCRPWWLLSSRLLWAQKADGAVITSALRLEEGRLHAHSLVETETESQGYPGGLGT